MAFSTNTAELHYRAAANGKRGGGGCADHQANEAINIASVADANDERSLLLDPNSGDDGAQNHYYQELLGEVDQEPPAERSWWCGRVRKLGKASCWIG